MERAANGVVRFFPGKYNKLNNTFERLEKIRNSNARYSYENRWFKYTIPEALKTWKHLKEGILVAIIQPNIPYNLDFMKKLKAEYNLDIRAVRDAWKMHNTTTKYVVIIPESKQKKFHVYLHSHLENALIMNNVP